LNPTHRRKRAAGEIWQHGLNRARTTPHQRLVDEKTLTSANFGEPSHDEHAHSRTKLATASPIVAKLAEPPRERKITTECGPTGGEGHSRHSPANAGWPAPATIAISEKAALGLQIGGQPVQHERVTYSGGKSPKRRPQREGCLKSSTESANHPVAGAYRVRTPPATPTQGHNPAREQRTTPRTPKRQPSAPSTGAALVHHHGSGQDITARRSVGRTPAPGGSIAPVSSRHWEDGALDQTETATQHRAGEGVRESNTG